MNIINHKICMLQTFSHQQRILHIFITFGIEDMLAAPILLEKELKPRLLSKKTIQKITICKPYNHVNTETMPTYHMAQRTHTVPSTNIHYRSHTKNFLTPVHTCKNAAHSHSPTHTHPLTNSYSHVLSPALTPTHACIHTLSSSFGP